MSEFANRLSRARSHLASPTWDEARAARNEGGVQRRVRRRARVRVAAMVALLPLFALGAWAARNVIHRGGDAVVAGRPAPRVLRLEGGATTVAVGDGGAVETVESSSARTVLRLVRGRAEFSVLHRESRVFRVEAGEAAVQVLGTEFSVERAGPGARVAVRSGRVRVFFGERFADLGAGEGGVFPAAESRPATGVATTAESGNEPGAVERAASTEEAAEPAARRDTPGGSASAWRTLAGRGQYDEAWAALSRVGSGSVRDDVNELFAASDVARLSGHPAQAVGPLNRVLASHRGDARAPLAAFTLGRVLLDDLGQAREAARAFAQVRSMARAGSLAEDALAREVEAWSRAGDSERARETAGQYLARYPEGRAARRVRRWGGVP